MGTESERETWRSGGEEEEGRVWLCAQRQENKPLKVTQLIHLDNTEASSYPRLPKLHTFTPSWQLPSSSSASSSSRGRESKTRKRSRKVRSSWNPVWCHWAENPRTTRTWARDRSTHFYSTKSKKWPSEKWSNSNKRSTWWIYRSFHV